MMARGKEFFCVAVMVWGTFGLEKWGGGNVVRERNGLLEGRRKEKRNPRGR